MDCQTYCIPCFCTPYTLLPFSPIRPTSIRSALPQKPQFPPVIPWHCSLLSVPFPVTDVFALPVPVFNTTTSTLDLRPELLGSLLWSSGLYLGIWGDRWGSLFHRFLMHAILRIPSASAEVAEGVADALHTLPFLLAGFAVDGILRATSGGNAVGAVASGLSVALYTGVGELGRLSAKGRAVSSADAENFEKFCAFGETELRRTGRCHLVDVRTALRRDARYARLARTSDGQLRTFIRKFAPRARRSPNGFYRGLSVRNADDGPRRKSAAGSEVVR